MHPSQQGQTYTSEYVGEPRVVPKLIYVHSSGVSDRARWLVLDRRNDGQIVFHLQDLCHPGRLSQVRQVTCPPEFAAVALDRGTLQITTNVGYMLLRPSDEHLTIEFRGLDDLGATKVTVLREEVKARLKALLANQPATVPN